ncbi:MAG: hypothetical protein EPN71_02035 [Rhodanobacter sp.]|nr:MAG: hypothetical protein EPN71_02035 [Rhodanobacter sp.]TAM40254.1 MAG: hypothetical protein EPN58_10990 [Rhodanobacter sp.]
MKIFQPQNNSASPEHERIYAIYEVWYTTVDFLAASLFLVGSVMFFWSSTQMPATWLFVIGSLCFALKPTLRLMRELTYLRMKKYAVLARHEQY